MVSAPMLSALRSLTSFEQALRALAKQMIVKMMINTV
jgi:hypothetical protein